MNGLFQDLHALRQLRKSPAHEKQTPPGRGKSALTSFWVSSRIGRCLPRQYMSSCVSRR